jgi:hypothetical protein
MEPTGKRFNLKSKLWQFHSTPTSQTRRLKNQVATGLRHANNADQRAQLTGAALAAYVDLTPLQYTKKNLQRMMRSLTRQSIQESAAATAAATVAANPIIDP